MKRKPLAERIANKTEWVNDCLMWTGAFRRDGYGVIQVWVEDKWVVMAAHRAVWFDKYGDISDGMWVLHECDIRACVNINHLYLGTRSDNEKDKVDVGTSTFQLLTWNEQWKRPNKPLKD